MNSHRKTSDAKHGRPKPEKCFCNVMNTVVFWGKLAGMMPLVVPRKEHSECKFKVSRKWVVYSACLQIVYVGYFCFSYGKRFICGPLNANTSDWYVMTFGYIVNDLDCLLILLMGVVMAKRSSRLLEDLSEMPKSANEIKVLDKYFRILMANMLAALLIMSCSHIYVADLRFSKTQLGCSTLEGGWAVLLRGVAVIFPTIQVAIVYAFCEVVCMRFQYISERTSVAIQNIRILSLSSKVTFQPLPTIHVTSKEHINNLQQLSESHQRISNIFSEINSCVGLQLLFAATSTLYAIVYYLFRYATSQHNDFASNEHERAHYVISLGYRLAKMLLYVTIGQRVQKAALLPLKVIERYPLVDLPIEAQQQVHTLLLQWKGQNCYLSACGVFNFGPWLLAPIVGNVITYLLVALQFNGATQKVNPSMKTSALF